MTSAEIRNRQCEATECGLACLAMAAHELGADIDLAWLRHHHPTSTRGATLAALIDIASAIGLVGRPVRCEPETLKDLNTPAILHWDNQHYVVLTRANMASIRIFDPRRGSVTISMQAVRASFTGVALELSPTPQFQKKVSTASRLDLLSMFRWTGWLSTGLGQVLVLSLLLQTYVLAAPLYVRFAIDDAALKGDINLLGVLAIGFGLFAIFNAAAEALRGFVLQRLSSALSLDMSYRLFHHLMRLPLAWFQRRRLADVFTRFNSLLPIRDVISNGLIAVVIDGVLSITTLVVMFVFSPLLAAVAVTGLVLSAGVRLLATPLMLKLEMNTLQTSIEEQGKRIETIRSIQTIKVMSAEPQRQAVWANRQVESIRAEQSSGLARMLLTTLQRAIDSIALVVVVYLAVTSVIGATITIGTVYAFLAYRSQFSDRTLNMIDRIIEWRMLSVHAFRLSDVVLTPTETATDNSNTVIANLEGRIELTNVSFRYSQADPFIVKSIDLVIPPGECTAIVGPSGCGKTTLLKMICGLYVPTLGEIRLDGVPINVWGIGNVRRSVGIVLQDDVLLSGSIADNIAFFSETMDTEFIWHCLSMASIADDIRKLPMQLQTHIGDTGSQFSGGQKQRLLLARALYKEPRVLILDEATSNLDVAREKGIMTALSTLPMTRIVVSHRPQTIAAADHVIVFEDGRLVPQKARRPAATQTSPARELGTTHADIGSGG